MPAFPEYRARRLGARKHCARSCARRTVLPADLILPLFVVQAKVNASPSVRCRACFRLRSMSWSRNATRGAPSRYRRQCCSSVLPESKDERGSERLRRERHRAERGTRAQRRGARPAWSSPTCVSANTHRMGTAASFAMAMCTTMRRSSFCHGRHSATHRPAPTSSRPVT